MNTMLSLNKAKKMAEEYLKEIEKDEKLALIENNTIERDFGWIFFYNSKRYIETDDSLYMLAGNGPIFVDKRTKELTLFGTAEPIEVYMEEYEKTNVINR